VVTSLLVIVVVLLLWAIYQIEGLQQRVERLHAKVNAIRNAVAPNEPRHEAKVANLRPLSTPLES
jgi:hypothetical protein